MESEQKHRSALKVIIVGLLFLIVIGGTAVLAAYLKLQETEKQNLEQTQVPQLTPTPTITPTTSVNVSWGFDGNNWSAFGNAPKCVEPLTILSPADVTKATAILYPGQTRSGDFKAHGGMRFDNSVNEDIKVTLAMDGYLYRGVRYIESGEVQYMLDFINPCGVLMRYDHLLTLSPEVFNFVDGVLPQATESTITTGFNTIKNFGKGEVIATAVGHKLPSINTGFDFGMYDLRTQNEISKDVIWAAAHENKKEQTFFAVCWLDYLSSTDMTIAKALPGSGTEGKTSDYCK